jgi:hypothetical protein
MITNSTNRETCSRCGNLTAAWDYNAPGPLLPLLARDADGNAVCDVCVAVETVATLKAGMPATAYLTNEHPDPHNAVGRAMGAVIATVTTWGGTVIGRAHIGPWQYSGAVRVRQFDAFIDGVSCYGKFGDMQCATIRPRKHQAVKS